MYSTAWGKTDGHGRFHALAAHSMDVAAVFLALCELPLISERLDTAAGCKVMPADLLRLAALVYLHDVGKLLPGFQAKGRPDLCCPADVRHAEAGWRVLAAGSASGHPLAPILDRIAGWGPAVEELLAAVFAHHGKPVPCNPQTHPVAPTGGYDMAIAAIDFRRMWEAAFPQMPATGPLPGTPAFVHLFAGLVALADWIGSDASFFAFVPFPGTDYPDQARGQAAEALVAIGLDLGCLQASHGFATVAGADRAPNSGQRLVGVADLARRLLLLEAETGSGKTEAALWRFALLYAAGMVSGLYFAVPTRAAARQLHRRVNAAVGRIFGSGAPEAVLAIPGLRVAGEATGHPLPDFRTRWDDGEGPQPARWAAEHATRFLAAPIAVGTVDQAMLAALQVKHAPLRGAALTRSLLVIDEVHASDAYMTEIVAELLKGHLVQGGHAMLMSATLGSTARARLLGHPQPDLATAATTPYPAVWTPGAPVPAHERPEGRAKAVRMKALPTMAAKAVAEAAIVAARAGARVLVIRNTVTAAAEAWEAVVAGGAEMLLMTVAGVSTLHHSRFAPEDRARLDAAAEASLAARNDRPAAGVIVIGSQTLEQSLDIDADFLITDLCPVDVLLQRIGRLHRHDLPRPKGFADPCCLVLLPEIGLDALAEPRFFNGLGAWKDKVGGWCGVYMDVACLALTAALVRDEPIWRIPEMNRRLVESATHPEARAAEIARRGPVWLDYEANKGGREAAVRVHARLKLLHRDQPFPDLFRCDEEAVMTRLGVEGLVVELAPGAIGPFGVEVHRLALPAHWKGLTPPEGLAPVEPLPGGFRLQLGKAALRYGRLGLWREKKRDMP
jgi:CRISPR-associated endonuclease/helicase Cas3